MVPPLRKVRFDAAVIQEAEKNSKKRSEISSDEEDDESGDLPLESQVSRAKRARKSDDIEEEDAVEQTDISNKTSLETEGIAIEPFHMKNENSDGTGFFDGDTYIFRKQVEEEPDGWLDELNEGDGSSDLKDSSTTIYNPTKSVTKTARADNSMDDWPEEELYGKIRPSLATESETIMDAISRYGALLKTGTPKARQNAKEAFDGLTEAASALMLRGKINIYQMKRSDLGSPSAVSSSSIPVESNHPVTEGSRVQWEYKGSADGQIHGPYDTKDMMNWIRAGYFVGSSAVQLRSIETSSGGPPKSASNKSTKDDLLSDLLDDDDDDQTFDDKEASYTIRGEWQMSDQVDFSKF